MTQSSRCGEQMLRLKFARNLFLVVAPLTVVLSSCTSSGHTTVASLPPPSAPATNVPKLSSSGSAPASGTASGGPSGSPSLPNSRLSTLPSVKITILPPVPITAPASFGTGISARLVRHVPVKITDVGPGAVTGSAATAFTIQFTNRSQRSISLASVQVEVTYGNDLAASPVNLNQGAAAGALLPGRVRLATYSFAIPVSQSGKLRVAVWIDPAHPTVVFTGAID